MSAKQFQQAVLTWFDVHGRTNLPWQTSISPYSVWVSEIMLQQTQVSTVIPYFERFMQSFPTVEALAAAPWMRCCTIGLGWATTPGPATCIKPHRCLPELGAEFPDNVAQLCELPGIGRSTAGAISSIAFKNPATILDGNVKRVLASYAAIDGWPGKSCSGTKALAACRDLHARTSGWLTTPRP